METGRGKSVHGSVAVDHEKEKSLDGHEEGVLVELAKDNVLESAKAKIDEVREQNSRLKQLLSQLMKDYQSLQKHFSEISLEQEQETKTLSAKTEPASEDSDQQERELVSLCLGRSCSEPNNNEKKSNNLINSVEGDMKIIGSSLSLGKIEIGSSLTMKIPSSEDSFEDSKEAESTSEISPSSKILKTTKHEGDEVSLRDTQKKRAWFSVRARVDTSVMNDGCQWRKYGQKIAKGNPWPRAYYRCTVTPTCPVRKRVERCSEDLTITTTRYEGTHNHPLPLSATAMASTTSAALSMLQSTTSINGLLNCSHFQDISQQQLYLPNSSMPTSTNSHPTMILDFTAPTVNTAPPRHFSSYLNFSSSSSSYTPSLDPNSIQQSSKVSQHSGGYGKIPPGLKSIAKQPTLEHCYQPFSLMKNQSTPLTSMEAIATVTKGISPNQIFQSELTSSVASFVSKGDDVGVKQYKSGHDSRMSDSFLLNTDYQISKTNGL